MAIESDVVAAFVGGEIVGGGVDCPFGRALDNLLVPAVDAVFKTLEVRERSSGYNRAFGSEGASEDLAGVALTAEGANLDGINRRRVEACPGVRILGYGAIVVVANLNQPLRSRAVFCPRDGQAGFSSCGIESRGFGASGRSGDFDVVDIDGIVVVGAFELFEDDAAALNVEEVLEGVFERLVGVGFGKFDGVEVDSRCQHRGRYGETDSQFTGRSVADLHIERDIDVAAVDVDDWRDGGSVVGQAESLGAFGSVVVVAVFYDIAISTVDVPALRSVVGFKRLKTFGEGEIERVALGVEGERGSVAGVGAAAIGADIDSIVGVRCEVAEWVGVGGDGLILTVADLQQPLGGRAVFCPRESGTGSGDGQSCESRRRDT